MENRKVSLTYKNSFQSVYEVNLKYARLKGNLSKKKTLKTLLIFIAFVILMTGVVYIENVLRNDATADVFFISIILLIPAMAIMFFISRATNKSQIKNFCRMVFYQGFDADSPKKAEFDEEKIIFQSGYSIFSVPYGEVDCVISDKFNFAILVGGDLKVRCIPKINQDPDALFLLDNLLREKLGEKFIYEM